jgi:phenylacetate-coenzyme A ligase PaaK-like adenylate-forming protein
MTPATTVDRLRDLVQRAAALPSLAEKYRHVDLGTGFCFDDLPTMSRAEATRAAQEAWAARGPGSGSAYLFTSGGSTSEPQLAWIPSGLHLDEITRAWQPLRETDTVANLAMPGRLWSAHVFYNRLAERVGAGVIGLGHVTDDELPDWLDFLHRQGTTVLVGTPGQLSAVLRRCLRLNHPITAQLRAAIWFGEPCTPELRELSGTGQADIELHGNYGSTETWVIGHNGPHCEPDVVHVLPHQHVELRDGAVLVTTLQPDAVGPVIRYHVGDRGAWVRCPCGRGEALRVLGRVGSLVKFGGTLVDPYELVRAAAAAPGVRAAQALLVESTPGQAEALELRVVPAGPVTPARIRERVLAGHIDLRFGLRGEEERALPIRIVDHLESLPRTAKIPAVLRHEGSR